MMLFVTVFIASLAFPPFLQAQDLHALLARQAPGSPAYECHAACGGVISAGRKPTSEYCTDSKFTSNLEACLECANTYDVWGDYGNSVTKAASACSLSASPLPSVAAASTSPAATSAHDHGMNSTMAGASATSTGVGAASSISATATSATGSAAGAATSAVAGGGASPAKGVNGGLISLGILLFAVV